MIDSIGGCKRMLIIDVGNIDPYEIIELILKNSKVTTYYFLLIIYYLYGIDNILYKLVVINNEQIIC